MARKSLMTNLGTSVREGIPTLNHNSIKVGFHGRDSHPMNGKGLKAAIAARSANIKACMETELKTLDKPVMNPYKQVEMYNNFRPLVPPKYWNKELYQKPNKDVYNLVKYEVESRKVFKGELNTVIYLHLLFKI